MNNFMTIVIGTDEPDDTPEHHEKLWSHMLSAFRTSSASVLNILGLRLRIAVSSIHRNVGNVYDAYQETQAIIDHFQLLDSDDDMISVEAIMLENVLDEQDRSANICRSS